MRFAFGEEIIKSIFLFFFFSSWVNNFGHEGLGLLLDALEKLLDKKQ